MRKPAQDKADELSVLQEQWTEAETRREAWFDAAVDIAHSNSTNATSDHNTATLDHSRADEDHGIATSDHNTASTDHTQATGDHTASVNATSAANTAAANAKADYVGSDNYVYKWNASTQ